MTDLVDQIFRNCFLLFYCLYHLAPLHSGVANVEYNDFQFWKSPIAEVIIDIPETGGFLSESDEADDEYDYESDYAADLVN